ncbi:RNA exonuclease 1 homolog [Trichonephila inaurata madagascariensis]|uniref:RNA exonuclease 1 homolog n=1 Tax=Trichonephila inaurata madagascariensis TaxID=2747483 RepID=A0A8X6I781_9ARAC|nr:RNA exonuclease 1 homolog [Trichonephila inaurata madagascariensis]
MSYAMMVENGFPLPDKKAPDNITLSENMYSKLLNQPTQMCRCGKMLSMLKDDWYLDVDGCKYHLGKQVFSGPDYGLYSCCKTTSQGCAFNKHHVSFRRPVENHKFVQTTDVKSEHNNQASNIFSIDCEMAFTTKGLEVVKISLIGVRGEVHYDSYVLPKNPILDYNTAFSGVREEHLRNVTTTLEDVQKRLLQLLNKNSILIGHGVENDLLALNIVHENVIDTSCVFPHERGHPMKNSLKYLAKIYLQKIIHDGFKGHDSVEDAQTCMELMLWKIYSETRSTFVAQPVISKPFFPKVIQSSNNFLLMANPPFKAAFPTVIFSPAFVCFQVTIFPLNPFLPPPSIAPFFNPTIPKPWWQM